uniref:Uncharacterized protein n=1 Tax=Brassica oleracea TaxID=3712 RepID=A0A3P6GPN7_BRAOL|nr:unnamed protein product [Brassica oleracea]
MEKPILSFQSSDNLAVSKRFCVKPKENITLSSDHQLQQTEQPLLHLLILGLLLLKCLLRDMSLLQDQSRQELLPQEPFLQNLLLQERLRLGLCSDVSMCVDKSQHYWSKRHLQQRFKQLSEVTWQEGVSEL